MAQEKPFVHLHLHSSYSLQDSSIQVKAAVKQASKLGMPAIALTDHAVLHGAITFFKACRAAEINPIVGCEMYVCRDHKDKNRATAGRNSHLLLLAKDIEGYHNLARLSSIAHLEGFYYKPRIDFDLLSQYSEGLIATSCCERGQIPQMILDGNEKDALELAGRYSELFGPGNFYLELEDHGKESEKRVCRGIVEMSKKLNLPLVATNDVHYMKQADAESHDLLLCLQSQAKFRDERRMRFETDQYYFKTADEMWKLFGEIPESLHNTVAIAEQCKLHIKLEKEADLHFPSYDVPEEHNHESYLHELTVNGIKRLYNGADIENPESEEEKLLRARYDMELGVIKKTGYVNYFLVVWDFIHWAKKQGVPVGPGRGSGAGSLVAYATGITAIDPIRFDLIFERFLNPDRVSPPDFDIDFCQGRRGEVIDYVKRKYGHENCAQIATFGTLGAKTVIRDLARVLEIPLPESDKLAKMVPDDIGITLPEAIEKNPELKQAVNSDPMAKQIVKHAKVLEGLHRNLGTHAAGVVIGETLLHDIIPLCRDKEGMAVAQYEMKPLEMTGLLKMDFLGLKTLTVIREAADNVKAHQGVDIDPETIDLADKKTFELLAKGDTVAVFQVESDGMQRLLRDFQADKIEEIIALIALYRPGPMEMIPGYIECKHGRKPIEYPHALLEPVLKETYGVFIYQEQVQRAANVLAGFTLAQGDLLRRAMGKKDATIMAEMKAKFVKGCGEVNDIPAAKATEVFELIEKFASYGFNKSHSAAYSFLTFQTAFFKAHYRPEFMAAVLSLEMGNAEKLTFFIDHCRDSGMEVLPPNVQQSSQRFRPENGHIRFGLAGIKNVGGAAVEALVAERDQNGPYKSFMDFCYRNDPQVVNKRSIEGLIKAGGFDWCGISRSRLLAGMEFALSRAEEKRQDEARGQTNLFAMLDGGGENAGEMSDDELPPEEPWPNAMMLAFEKELLGFYISGHPLDDFRLECEQLPTHSVEALQKLEPRESVRVCGLLDNWRLFFNKNEQQMASFRLTGLGGTHVECIMFSQAAQTYAAKMQNELPVILAGETKERDGNVQVSVDEIFPLTQGAELYAEGALLRLQRADATVEKLQELRSCVQKHKGHTPMQFEVLLENGAKVRLNSDGQFRMQVGIDMVDLIANLFGDTSFQLVARKKSHRFPPKKRSFGVPQHA